MKVFVGRYFIGNSWLTTWSSVSYIFSSMSFRLQIWKQLQGFTDALAWPLGEVKHHYLGKNLPYKESVLPVLPSVSYSYGLESKVDDCSNIVTINSLLNGNITTSGEKVYIFDSWIGKDVTISLAGPCFLNGLQVQDCNASLELPGGCVWQQFAGMHHDVVTCYGWTDSIMQPHGEPSATIFNTGWSDFFARTHIVKEDLWKNLNEVQDIMTARLFVTDLSVTEQMGILLALVRSVCSRQQEEWKSVLQKWRSCSRISLAEVMFRSNLKKVIKTQEDIFLECLKQLLVKTADDLRGISLIPLFQYLVSSKNMLYILLA